MHSLRPEYQKRGSHGGRSGQLARVHDSVPDSSITFSVSRPVRANVVRLGFVLGEGSDITRCGCTEDSLESNEMINATEGIIGNRLAPKAIDPHWVALILKPYRPEYTLEELEAMVAEMAARDGYRCLYQGPYHAESC